MYILTLAWSLRYTLSMSWPIFLCSSTFKDNIFSIHYTYLVFSFILSPCNFLFYHNVFVYVTNIATSKSKINVFIFVEDFFFNILEYFVLREESKWLGKFSYQIIRINEPFFFCCSGCTCQHNISSVCKHGYEIKGNETIKYTKH